MSASGSDEVAGGGQAGSPQDFQRVLRSFGVEGGQYSYRPFVDRSFDVTGVPEAVERHFDQAEHDTAVEEQITPAPQIAVAPPPPPVVPEPPAIVTETAPPPPVVVSAPVTYEPPAADVPAEPPVQEAPVQAAPVPPAPVPPIAEQAPPAAPDPASVPYANVAAAPVPPDPAPVTPAPQARVTGPNTRMVEPFSRPQVRTVQEGVTPSRVPSRSMNAFPRTSASSISERPVDRGVADEWSPVPKARLSPRERPRPGDLSFFFQGMRDTRDEKKFFPVASTRSVRSNVSRMTSMTKTDTNSSQASRPGSPVASPDGSPTMAEVFMTLGGRATELLSPRPSLREALLRRRENEEES
ncbi:hypothetical protein IFJ82_12935 [Novacetimonas hansenii]|uniref:hypothetical protein n=1 Tax=Novacetimonas hansenii TaxID=436 RepID=UPI0017875DF6|nr:hypothetical protein [Novacetimonas hansenii]QOF94763.1 hypothetical protein IFJ82_12935 [Novacetimonas hansenii]